MEMSDEVLIDVFQKNEHEAIVTKIASWKSKVRIDIRTYTSPLNEGDPIPTWAGISLPLDKYLELYEVVLSLGDVMGRDKTVGRIEKNNTERIHIGINQFKGRSLIFIRTFFRKKENDEWFPTKKGISINVDLYSYLLKSIEKLKEYIESLKPNGNLNLER